MRLYLVQHGDSLPKERDPERPLSEKGRRASRAWQLCSRGACAPRASFTAARPAPGRRPSRSPPARRPAGYYDQRLNRERLRHYVRGATVLDVFSYLGAFGIQAAVAGAESVVCVDSSQKSPEWIRRNADRVRRPSINATGHPSPSRVLGHGASICSAGRGRPAVRRTPPAHNGLTPREARLPRTTRQRFALPGAQRLNNVAGKIAVQRDDAFEVLRRLRAKRQRFNVVILDPPAFIKRKKDIKEGTLAYQRLNQMAMQVLAKDGILVSCSCSYHLHRDVLREILLKGSRHLDRFLEIPEEDHQGPDHPVHPAIPETGYLKAFFCRVLPS